MAGFMHENLIRPIRYKAIGRFLSLAAFAVGVSACTPGLTPPERLASGEAAKPRLNTSELTAQCLQKPHAPATCYTMAQILNRLDLELPPGFDRNEVGTITAKVVIWEINNFGTPPDIPEKVMLRVKVNAQPPARLILGHHFERTVEIEPLLLHEGVDHYLAHELFHALFQPTRFLDLGDNDAEAWATYAQYRYRYPTLSNMEILKNVVAEFGLTAAEVEKSNLPAIPWAMLDEQSRRHSYALAVIALLKRSEAENYVTYRQMISYQPASASPAANKPPSKRPVKQP